ncbi:MAG TPA: response regulator [Pedobacter sp.]|jgi:CheY-like chemotaxis protein
MNLTTDTVNTVCIIDDDQIHHFMIGKSLQIQGLSKNLISFHDANVALNFFKENIDNCTLLPDVIFVDLNMPVINGWQFLEQFQSIKTQIKKDIRVFVVSSSIDESEMNRAISINFVNGYLEKPVRPEAIRQAFCN